MILNICEEPSVLEVFRVVKVIITIIKIVVPLILIISGSITFIRAIHDSETSKALNIFAKKCIAAILIFLIPTFVNIIVNTVDGNSNYMDCFKYANKEGIQNAYNNRARSYVLTAKNTLNYGSYQAAVAATNKLKDESVKASLKTELKKVNEEIEKAQKEREEAAQQGTTGTISPTGKYTKAQIIDMGEQQVRDMTNQQFIEFMASAARIVYAEYGGVLPSITIAQAILESGYGNHFEATSHNVFGLIGYPGSKPKVNRLRKFDNFYEATYYHYAYFENYRNVYNNFLTMNANHQPQAASRTYLHAYAGGSKTYGPTIETLINQYNLTQYDY